MTSDGADKLGRDDSRWDYAEPNGDIDFTPFRQSNRLPIWADPQDRYPKLPVRDYGTYRQHDQAIYHSPEVMRDEWEKIFKKSWMLVGHITDVPRKNSFMKVDRGPESFLVVRGDGEELTGFYNFCSHRGAQLVKADFGSTQKFVCPFHKWEFSTDGELTKIQDRESFRTGSICYDLDLPKIRVEHWRGWICINMDMDAVPLVDFLGPDFIERAEAYIFEDLIRIRDVEQEWPANWKVAREIFLEGYHVQATHPQYNPAVNAYHAQHDLMDNGHGLSVFQFMSPNPEYVGKVEGLAEEHEIFLREAGVPESDWPASVSDVPQAVINAKRNRKDPPIDYSRFTDGQLIHDWNQSVFPATETFYHPEGYFIQHWLPHPSDPEKCIYQVQVYAVPGISELPSFMAVPNADLSGRKTLPRTYIGFDDMESLGPVIKQDRDMVPRLQRATHSDGFRGGVFSEQEVRIRHFHDQYFRLMGRQHP